MCSQPYSLTTSRKVSAINSSQSAFLLSLRKMIWQSWQDSPHIQQPKWCFLPRVEVNMTIWISTECENFRSPTRLCLYFWPQNWMLDIPENLIWLGDVKIELKFISQALFGFVWLELVPDKQGRRCRILWFHLKNLIRTTFFDWNFLPSKEIVRVIQIHWLHWVNFLDLRQSSVSAVSGSTPSGRWSQNIEY